MSETADVDLEDEVEMTPLDDIYPYENNPKNHPPEQIEQIVNSITATGSFDQPIVVDAERGGEIIKGHGRYKAATELGLDEVPVIWREGMTEEEVKTARIADNKSQLDSGFDYDALGDELETLETDLEVDVDDIAINTGFDEDVVDDLTTDEPADPDELFDADDEDEADSGEESGESDDEGEDTEDTTDSTDDATDGESEATDDGSDSEDDSAHERRGDTICPSCGFSFDADKHTKDE